jgi:hypothetical protein
MVLPLFDATVRDLITPLDAKSADEARQILGFLVSFDQQLAYNPYIPINDTLASSGSNNGTVWNCMDNQVGACCTQCRCPISHFFWGTDYSVCGGASLCCDPPAKPQCANCGCGHMDAGNVFVAVSGEACVTYGTASGCY